MIFTKTHCTKDTDMFCLLLVFLQMTIVVLTDEIVSMTEIGMVMIGTLIGTQVMVVIGIGMVMIPTRAGKGQVVTFVRCSFTRACDFSQ